VALPVGYEANEGGYFGLPRTPDIGEVIDNENERAESDSYDKVVGVDVALPTEEIRSLWLK